MVASSGLSLRESRPAVPIYVWRVDGPDLLLDGFNDAALALTSGGVRTLVGRRASELYADSPEVVDLLTRCREGQTSIRHRLGDYRYRSVARSADLDVTLTWVPPDRVVVAGVEQAGGTGPAEDELQFLASVLTSLPAASVAYRCRNDAEWTPLYVSDGCAALTGYTPAELVGNRSVSLVDLIHEDDLAHVVSQVNEALAAGRPFQVTYRIRSRRGDVRWVWERGRGVGGDGAPLIEGLALDVTAVHEHEDRLRQLQGLEILGQLTAGMAHDFNNLLSVIMVDAELAREELAPAPAAPHDLLADIEQSARSGAALIQKFAAVARPHPLNLEPSDLREVVSETGALLRRVLPENIELRLRLDDGVGPARADRSAVHQILLNLVLNARDAMPRGGVLDIALTGGERSASLTVTDTGIGMEAAAQARVFDPFFTTKPAGRGSGLGLAVVHGLVRRHRGDVRLTSAPGAGTTVRIDFPLAEEKRPPAPSAGVIAVGTPTVLVVEDEPALRDAARRALEHLGYRVVTAADAEAALAHLDANGVDVVVSDLMLPRKNGADLLRALRERGRLTPFLLMTGYGPEEVPGWTDIAADVVLLQKPWTMPELAGALRQAMDAGGRKDVKT